jgi:hypothetical protein
METENYGRNKFYDTGPWSDDQESTLLLQKYQIKCAILGLVLALLVNIIRLGCKSFPRIKYESIFGLFNDDEENSCITLTTGVHVIKLFFLC